MNWITTITTLLAGITPIVLIVILAAAIGGMGLFFFKFLIIKEFIGGFLGFIKDLFGSVIPKKWDSGKTLILMGAFSWAVSLIVGPIVQSAIAIIGWIFLISGIHWVMHEEKDLKKLLTVNSIFLGPWITGALICYFLFASTEGIPPIAFIVCPCLSALIAGLPKFIGSDPVTQVPVWVKPKPGDRQYLVNLALINLLLSSWIQLGFVTRQWLVDYPTLASADFSRSSFVMQLRPNSQASSRGVELLSRATNVLKADLQGQSWSQVERWLLNFDQNVAQLQAIAMGQMGQSNENAYWQVQGKILPGEYNVRLFSVWSGPSADTTGFHFAQTCEIARVAPIDLSRLPSIPGVSLPAVGNAKVQCTPIEGPIKGAPDPGAT